MVELLYTVKRFPLVCLWVVLVFLISGLIVNVIQLLILPIWSLNKTLYRWLNMHIVYLHWCQLTFLAEWWSDLDLRLYGNKEDFDKLGKESAICLGNHRSDIDWLIGWVLADRAGVLGATKCYMKGYLKFLPIMGFSWFSSEYAFVSRNWQTDQKVLKNSLETLEDFPYPFWMAIFAEGTRLTDAKLQASLKYARSKNLPELQHHLLPRSRGFAITTRHLQDKVPVVYDIEVGFPKGSQPNMKGMLFCERYEVHLLLRRIPVKDIPKETIDDTSNWCRRQFQEKDKAMSYFLEHGEFPAPRVKYPRKYVNLVFSLVWHILLSVPLFSYILSVLLSGSIYTLAVASVVVLVAFLILKVLLHFTDSRKGSDFGLKTSSVGNGTTRQPTKKEQ